MNLYQSDLLKKSIFDKISKITVTNFKYVKKSTDKTRIKELNDANEVINIQELVMLLLQRGFRFGYIASYKLLHYPKSLADSDGFLKKI